MTTDTNEHFKFASNLKKHDLCLIAHYNNFDLGIFIKHTLVSFQYLPVNLHTLNILQRGEFPYVAYVTSRYTERVAKIEETSINSNLKDIYNHIKPLL